MKTPTDHEILDHGVTGSQYFQGCGTYGTEYTEVYTGIGDSAHEALEDALEQAATSDWDVEEIHNYLSEGTTVPVDADENSELHHFVSIRLKGE
jgi:hypothetical protein